MNHPFFKLHWLNVVCALLLAACTSDDELSVPPANNVVKLVLSKVVFPGKDTTIYEYNAQKKVAKVLFTANESIGSKFYKEFAYDTQGRVVKSTFKLMDGTATGYITFEHANNVLTKMSSFSRSQGTGDYTHDFDNIPEFNGAKQVVKLITRNPNKPASEYRYTNYMYDAAGNIVQIMEYVNKDSGPVNDYVAEYTYDNNKNPYRELDLFGFGPLTFSPHNILTEKETYPTSGLVRNTTRTYTYNEAGYPLKEIVSNGNNTYQVQNIYKKLR